MRIGRFILPILAVSVLVLGAFATPASGAPIATGATADVSLPVGTHALTLTVSAGDGETSSDTVTVTVEAKKGGKGSGGGGGPKARGAGNS